VTARFDPRAHAYDDQNRHAGMIYVLMLVVAAAFGGFVWQLYSSPETPHIAAAPGPYKVEPPPLAPPDPSELSAPASTEALVEPAAVGAGPPQLAPAPRFVADGPYVAQLAALQSEAGTEVAWRRLSSRAPGLFASAQLDVERADLGARGIYYRVRAGFFPDRANAARFCERIRQMGQDCIAVAR